MFVFYSKLQFMTDSKNNLFEKEVDIIHQQSILNQIQRLTRSCRWMNVFGWSKVYVKVIKLGNFRGYTWNWKLGVFFNYLEKCTA